MTALGTWSSRSPAPLPVDTGVMDTAIEWGRTFLTISTPRKVSAGSNPGNRLQYKRVNGPFTLIMYSSGETKLPFGNFPRLILAWVSTEAVRTQSRELILGPSLTKFMKTLGVYSSGGNVHTKEHPRRRRAGRSGAQ